MAYEVFRKTRVRSGAPAISIVPDGRIGLNATAVRILVGAGIKSVNLLWDKANHKIAVKAAHKSDKDSFAVSVTAKSSGSIRAKSFINHIGWAAKRETLPATWSEKDGMFEVVLPERYLGLGNTSDPEKAKTTVPANVSESRNPRKGRDCATTSRRFEDSWNDADAVQSTL